jgi:flagellin
MSRINTNVAALTAQRGLAVSQRSLADTLQRLSTGLRINNGADDPAGLIASEGLRSEINGINQAIDNSSRASNVISTTEGALGEVANLLLDLKTQIVQAANSGALSPAEIQANQLQVNSDVESITRISNNTTFAGLHLIDGSLDYLTSGVASSAIAGLQISHANFGTSPNIPVDVKVITSARTADLQFRAASVASSVTLRIAGNAGTQTLTFASGATSSAIALAVNRIADSTGVAARLINPGNAASGVEFLSAGYGSRQFVSIQSQSGSFNTVDSTGAANKRVVGRDAVATVNGSVSTADGLNLQVNTSSLDMHLTLNKSFGQAQTSFVVTGGGALFQVGPQVNSAEQVSIGIQSVAASNLGNSEVGYLSDLVTGGKSAIANGKGAEASAVLEAAINQVAVLRGKLGAFEKNTLQTTASSLGVALEKVTSSESNIRDANFAQETSNLTRAQILSQAGTSVLATANSTPQNVLALLK